MAGLLPREMLDQPQGQGLLRDFLANGGLAGLLGMQPLGNRMVDYTQQRAADIRAGNSAPPAPGSAMANEAADIAGAFDFTGAIKAYHGSPHTFDRFDLSKIGTGEGAQTYGHGLYFAEGEDVARHYQQALTSRQSYRPSAEEVDRLFDAMSATDAALDGGKVSFAGGTFDRAKWRNALSSGLIATYELPESVQRQAGSLYTVSLDVNPDDLLDWDKPLSQQPEKVRKALEIALDDGRGNHPTFGPLQQVMSSKEITGGDAYDRWGMHKTELTRRLREAGIPGIRYLDGGSRAGGEGTRNFVMFDDALVDILERNGQPVAKP